MSQACSCHFHLEGAPTTTGEHTYVLDADGDPERWRWRCSCKRHGHWQQQSPSVAYHAWLRAHGLPQHHTNT